MLPASPLKRRSLATLVGAILLLALFFPTLTFASDVSLKIPDLNKARFFDNSIGGQTLLTWGMAICGLGFLFGIVIYRRLQAMPVHESMREVSETIYATCKTYLKTQVKFILLLEVFIGAILIIYFGWLATDEAGKHYPPLEVGIILLFSLVGIAGSVSVAWFGIRINTFANSRTALASLRGKPYPVYAIPIQAGMSVGMVLISVEL
ncbi:MAG TPA: sodium/proton-translocating pyrophosphatase, partial [Tepidisphaeraceae bacterium]